MKFKSALIVLAASLILLLAGGLVILVLPRLDSLPREVLLIVTGTLMVVLVLLSAMLRSPGQKSERLARQALEELGFERENWISRQYRGTANGREFEILPFFTKGYGDTLALHILLRGTFSRHLTIALPRGLSNFVVWEAEIGGQIKPDGYAGYLVYTDRRQETQALLAQPEMDRLVKELFEVPSQTPIVLEISQGVIRFRVGRLDLLNFDEQMLRRWLQILGEIGQLAGIFQPLHALDFDEGELSSVRSRMRWTGILALLFALALSAALFFILLNYLK